MAEIILLEHSDCGRTRGLKLSAPVPKTWEATAEEAECDFDSVGEVTSDFCTWLKNHPDPSDVDITNKKDYYADQHKVCSRDIKDKITTYVGDLVNIWFADDRSAKVKEKRKEICLEVTAGFDAFNVLTKKGMPGETIKMAKNRIKNTGSVTGKINTNLSRIDLKGNVVETICDENYAVMPGACTELDNTNGCTMSTDNNCSSTGELWVTLPSTTGTYYYGFKIWGEDEDEPEYPSPTAAIHGTSTSTEKPSLVQCLFPRVYEKSLFIRSMDELIPRVNCIKNK